MTGPQPSGPADNRPPGHPPVPPTDPHAPGVLLSLFVAVMCAALLAVGCFVMLVGLTRAVW